MKDLTEQIYDELNAQVVRMLNHSLNQASRIVELETQLQDHSAQAFSIGETYASALSRIAYLEKRIEFNGDHSQDGIAKRDERIAELEAQLEEAETLISQTSHGAAERISAMEAQLAAQTPVREGWIACSDRLPELYQSVVLLNENRWMNTGNDEFDTNWHGAGWLIDIGYTKSWAAIGETRSMTLESVTHWMPLPAAPVQQEGS